MAGQHDNPDQGSWILNVVELMRAEWGCTLEQAVFHESLTAALTLWPSMLARHGAEVHFDFGDQARQDGKDRMRAWIADHYQVDATLMPPPDSPWLLLGDNVGHP